MEVHYKFVTGDSAKIILEGEVAEELARFDDADRKRKRNEKNKIKSFDRLVDEQNIPFADAKAVTEDVIVERIEVEKLLAVLSPEQRALLWRVYAEGVPMAVIARDEGVTKGAIRNRISKALSRLGKVTSG